ncbi:unnamed protein product [Arctia plantaginis]|uniref:MD-2-related lipid-recognition domain-containing protein n=1 Tax=Arctia plantaginis TaxID=874455 RepID=A0A8S1A3C2_ARCPL|nr:unnamed protein product [Arctia plantaginis]CAB3256000.1 unnamed protein product [Arctia plantaginis]
MRCAVLFALIHFVVADPKYITRKLCKDVDSSQCTVHSVIIDPCVQGVGFCTMKINKNYAVTLDVVPRFSASKLKVSIKADVNNNGNFTTTIKVPSDACDMMYCPLQSQERRIFDVYMNLDKKASGKFPVEVKLWNEDNESQACCVNFNVKVK